MSKAPFSDWQARVLRVTLFPASIPERNSVWWEAVTDQVPDEIVKSPKSGAVSVKGSFELGHLLLNIDNERIDWLLTKQSEPTFPLDLELLGSAEDTFASFSKLISPWLTREDLPTFERFAFGATLFLKEESVKAVYDRLSEYTPVSLPVGSSDFIFQLNLRGQVTTNREPIEINRLTNWTVTSIQNFANGKDLAQSSSALRLELDFNTVPKRGLTFDSESISLVFPQLVEQAISFVTEGIRG